MQRKKLALLPLRSWRPWRLKLDDLSPYHTVGNLQSSHTDWQLEAPWPGAAGIEVKHTVFHFLFRFVRVAADHHLESRCLRMQIERIHIMQNVDTDSRQFYNFCLRKAAAAGKSTRWGASKRCERPSFSIDPQLAVGGGTPRPRKLMVASASTAPAMPMAACTMTGWIMLGQIWWLTMRQSLAPSARAASTNSRSFTASTWARTRRA